MAKQTKKPTNKAVAVKTKAVVSSKPDKVVSWKVAALAIVAGFLLLIANSALWVNNVLFNNAKFTSVTTTALLSESSRTSIAGEVVDQALADRPIAQRILSQPATKLVAGLLDTNLAEKAVTRAVSGLQTAVTTKNPQNIEIDLTGVKNVASKLITIADTANIEVKTPERELPDKIVLFDASKVPNVYAYGSAMLWLAPISLIAGAVLLAYPHIKRRSAVMKIMLVQGAALLAIWVLALGIGPLFRPMVLSSIASSNARVVVENVYNAFITTFNEQSSWLLAGGLLLVLIPAASYAYRAVRTMWPKKIKS